MTTNRNRGIIFDMDNTLLRSRIDFAGMKQAVFELLRAYRLCDPALEWQRYTASQLIEMGRQSGHCTQQMEDQVWAVVTAFEKEGMHEADLETGVTDVLAQLHEHFQLVILTNNAFAAATEALVRTGIIGFFDSIVAREQMTALKPSPSGITYILEKHATIPVADWLMVGDSWIDGKAAQDGSVKFVAYQGSRQEMETHNVSPCAYLTDIRELLAHDFITSTGTGWARA